MADADERPTKLRKLDVSEHRLNEDIATSSPSELIQTASNAHDALPQSNSKPEETAADPADTVKGEPGDVEQKTPEESGSKRRHQDPDPAEHERNLLQHQNGDSSIPITKSQMKKLRRREEWEAGRDDRKARRKQKTKERRVRQREEKAEEAQRLKLLQQQQQDSELHLNTATGDENANNLAGKQRRQREKQQRWIRLPITILIDCGFDNLMMEKERISLGSQLTRAYSDNHRAPYQAHLVLSSWGGLLKERFDTVLDKHHLNWKNVRFDSEDFVEVAKKMDIVMRDSDKGGKLVGCFTGFAAPHPHKVVESVQPTTIETKDALLDLTGGESAANTAPNGHVKEDSPTSPQNPISAQQHPTDPSSEEPSTILAQDSPEIKGEIIYLTSDSPNTLTRLSPFSTYIVGGLVDKNRHKGICYKTACDRGIKTAKLPIGEYLDMSSRKVLTTNHVVEILLRWLEEADGGKEDGAWGRAFLRVIPKRKGGKLRDAGNDGQSEDEDEEGGVSLNVNADDGEHDFRDDRAAE